MCAGWGGWIGVKPMLETGFRLDPFTLSPFSDAGVFALLNVRFGLGGAEITAS